MSAPQHFDHVVVGGGILGIATARELQLRRPAASVLVLEKEPRLATHQTGHNSGVIHAGVYYKPGSLKAKLGVAGRDSMEAFCKQHGIAHEICGKVIVATDENQLGALDELERRSRANGVLIERVDEHGLHELEPHVRGIAGLHSPRTGIADFPAVTRRLAELFEAEGGSIRLSAEVTAIDAESNPVRVIASGETLTTGSLVNCGGLHSDRLARLSGADPGLRIVPFRGEYHSLTPDAEQLIRALIYPVPDPNFPFLGVHLTRGINGSVHAGPNAVLATSREGYTKRDFRGRDFFEAVGYRGFWRLVARHPRRGAGEAWRSLSRRAFAKAVRELVPDISRRQLQPHGSGVRAQALLPDGSLADDFVFVRSGRTLHVCNAPSPAATASLEIAREIANQLLDEPSTAS